MKPFVCWTAKNVSETVFIDVGALSRDLDPIFLAAHSPARVAHVSGVDTETGVSGERSVLDALVRDIGQSEKNSIIAVLGAPGTGKSHIVRWVKAQIGQIDLPVHVVYVPREVRTLKDLLKVLIDSLPGDGGSEMLARVELALGAVSEAEVASRLRTGMEDELRWGYSTEPSQSREGPDRDRIETRERFLGDPDPDGRRRNGMADVISLESVRDHLERPDGTLRSIASAALGTIQTGAEATTQFTVADVPRHVGGGPLARNFFGPLRVNPQPYTDLLNDALGKAYPKFVGLHSASGETLESLFREAREDLRRNSKELVLLFEDLAQFGLLDQSLYDEFLVPPGDRFAPIRVVFAITRAKRDERVPEAVQQRTTHVFEVLPIEAPEGADSGDQLRQFLARYLNLVRLGRSGVAEAWAGSSDGGRMTQAWVPSACASLDGGFPCELLGECHAGFGKVDLPEIGPVGLYPFNAAAIQRLASEMGHEAGNPRSLLTTALEQVVVEAGEHIATGSYPDSRVDAHFDMQSYTPIETLRQGTSGDVSSRLIRANIVWGNDTVETPITVKSAFSLPVGTTAKQDPAEKGEPDVKPVRDHGSERVPLPYLSDVNAWSRATDTLKPSVADALRGWLFELVGDRLNLDQDLIHTGKGVGSVILSEELKPISFHFSGVDYGRRPAAGKPVFDLTPDRDTDALIALLWWRHEGTWQSETEGFLWPTGYTPAKLQRALDQLLDRCAATVRASLRTRVLNHETRDALVGLSVVMDAVARQGSDSWQEVSNVARSAANEVNPSDWLVRLFGVRQGGGEAQLVDLVASESTWAEASRHPWHFLDEVARNPRLDDLIVSVAARLRDAISKASESQVAMARDAVKYIDDSIADCPLTDVVDAARNLKSRSMPGLFRPANATGRFDLACETLLRYRADWDSLDRQLLDTSVDINDAAVQLQPSLRSVTSIASALGTIREVAKSTQEEAATQTGTQRSGGSQRQKARDMAAVARDRIALLEQTGGVR